MNANSRMNILHAFLQTVHNHQAESPVEFEHRVIPVFQPHYAENYPKESDLLKIKTYICRNLKHEGSLKLLNQLAFGFISKDDSKAYGFSAIHIAIQAIEYKKFGFYYVLCHLRIEGRKL